MAGNVQDWDDPAPAKRAEAYGHDELKGLLLLIIHNAAQDASGRGVRVGRSRRKEWQEKIVVEGRRWLLSDADHAPAADSWGILQGASFRWICRMLDIDPDVAQAEIRATSWEVFCDRMTEVTRSVRRGPEVKPRSKPPQNASRSPRFDDRRSSGTHLARSEENAAKAI